MILLGMHRQALPIALLTGLSTFSSVFAQQPNLRHYTAADGLAQSQALAVTQDSAGYLWFGNYGGLARYDGSEFESWTSQQGLPSNTVLHLEASADARLAIAAAGGMLCELRLEDAERGAADRPPSETGPATELPGAGALQCRGLGESVVIHDLAFGDAVWAATDRGLYRFGDSRLQRFELHDGLPSEQCRAVHIEAGWLWVGTEAGLVRRRLDKADARFEPVPGLEAHRVRALAGAEEGLYVATTGGLARLRDAELTWAPMTATGAGAAEVQTSESHEPGIDEPESAWPEPVALAAGGGTVWVASHAGVRSWDGRGTRLLDSRCGLPGDIANALTLDRESNLWIATDFGVTKLAPGPFLTYGEAAGAPNPVVRAIAEDRGGQLWIGTRGGVASFANDRFTTIALPELRDPRVYSLADHDGGLWIGTRSGLLFWQDEVRSHLTADDGLPSDYVPALYSAGEDLWIGTDRGLVRRVGGALRAVEHPLLDDAYVLNLAGDGERIWAGLRAGGVLAIKLAPDGAIQRVEPFGREQGLSDLTVWSLDVDPDGAIWVGTNGDGAFRVHRDQTVERFRAGDELHDDFIWQVEATSKGDVWFYTNRGLCQRDRHGDWHHFDTAHGLPDLEGMATAVLEDRRGRLWFGTSKGLLGYDSARRFRNQVPPDVRVKDVRSQKLGALLPGAVIPANAGLLTVRFTALSFREENAVRFRYRLDGENAEWSEPIAERSLSFAGLGAGRHRLLIEAMNDAGIASPKPAVVAFEIRPSLWQTWPVRLLALALVLGLGWAATSWRTRQLQKERRRLGQLVEARTRELHAQNLHLEEQIDRVARADLERQQLEERLRQSEKMEAVGRLAGGVAHDFNNLLTTISGFGELLSDKLGTDHPQQRDVREILAAARRAARLTEQLLAFGRKQVIAPKVWGLSALVEELASMLERLVGETIELRLELEAPADTVRCDRGQLEQVILNLAVNARDAMPEGGRLILRTRSEVLLTPGFGYLGQEIEPGSYVVLEVIDTGHGIDPAVLEHIFEPFFTTKDVGQGTGLGLATVYGVVQQNGGSVDVDSAEGRGSRFIIRLPHVEEQAQDGHTSGSMPLIRIGRQKNVVLVVEDEPTVRDLMCGILRKYGYTVLEAASAQKAFEISRDHEGTIHLLLTDVVMPELDGRKVATRLADEREDLKVLYVSGYPDDYLGERGILPQSTEFLNKPFTPKKLIKKVRAVLDEKPV